MKRTIIVTITLICTFVNISAQQFKNRKEQAEFMQTRIDSVAIGKSIPNFTMINEKGEELSFSSLIGKVVVIDIWATWCKPCIALSPEFEKIKTKFIDEEVEFISFSVDEKVEKWKNYIESHTVNYERFWVGKNSENPILWFTYGEFEIGPRKVWAESIPKFVIINKEGKVEALDFGQPGMSVFRKTIKKALKG